MRVLALATKLDLPEAHLLAGLSRLGFRVDLMTGAPEGHNDVLGPAGVEAEHLALPSRFSPRAFVAVRSRLRRGGYDVVHHFSARALTNGLAASVGFPARHVAYRGTMGRLSRWDPLSRASFLSRRVDRLVCVSEAVRRYLLGLGVPPERAVTVYKGHDVAWYDRLPAVDRDAAFGTGPARDGIVIGCVANVRPVKGVDVLVRAFGMMPPDPAVRLVLVGRLGGSGLEREIALSPARDRIVVTGFRDDAPAVARACDVFVMPSVAREGLPKAVIEAMAGAVPPVVTSVGGLPELVLDGECGLVVPPGDPGALAAALSSLVGDGAMRSRLGAAARRRIETDFSVRRTVEATAEVYRSVTGGTEARAAGT